MKKIVILTHAPQGTLGDPSSAAKLQEILSQQAKQKGKKVQIEVLVDVELKYKERVQALFQDNQNHQLIHGYQTEEGKKQIKGTINDADFIIVYPTPHFMDAKTAQLIASIQKPVLSMTEYEHDVAHNQQKRKKFIDTIPGTIYLSSGFGCNNIGIYIEEEKANKEQLFSRIHPNDRKKFPDDLNPNSGLYFGYFNKMASARNGASPANFIAYAAHENSEMKHIDMIMPLMPQIQKDVIKQNTIAVLMSADFINNLKTCGTVLLSYSNTGSAEQPKYYMYQQEGAEYTAKKITKEEFEAQERESNKVIRIINPFPLNPQSMQALMGASEPVCMLTGNQSFSEGLSLAKIPFYQAVVWHVKLYDSLISSTKEFPVLNTWFTLLKNRGVSSEKVAAFYRENKTNLQEEMGLFRQYLLGSKDITKNIGGCIDFIDNLSLPKRFNVFLNHLILNQDFFADAGSVEKRDIWITEHALMTHLEPYLLAASNEEVAQILQNLKDNIRKINPNQESINFEKLIISLKYKHPHLDIITPDIAINECFIRSSCWDDSEEQLEIVEASDLIKAFEFLNPLDFTLEQKKQFFRNIEKLDSITIRNDTTINAKNVLSLIKFLENNTDKENMKQVLNIIFTKQINTLDGDTLGPSNGKGLFSQLNETEKTIILNTIELTCMVNQSLFSIKNENSEIEKVISSETKQNVSSFSEESQSFVSVIQFENSSQDVANREHIVPNELPSTPLLQKQKSIRDTLKVLRDHEDPTQTESVKMGLD
ncbi:hypothetical protein Lsan_2582 [Legionella santicrucis]|uniref:Uncharacterized protein n=1 Tax=Legionella santicrucis TaxID=45074 RepID=A0A0W0YJ86_9GAMM|nr:hypothetical protein [Legionella santicrucis]KTD56960.1 hypothetical protein Lsan_2582 [Legionella santicrucis]